MPTFAGSIQNACVKNPSGTSITVQSRCAPCCTASDSSACRLKVNVGASLPYAYGFVSCGFTLTASPSSDSDFLFAKYYPGTAGVLTYAAPAYGICAAGTMYYVSSLPTSFTTVLPSSPFVSIGISDLDIFVDVYGLYEAGLVGTTFSIYVHVFSRSITNLTEINNYISSAIFSTPCASCVNSFYCGGGSGSIWQAAFSESTFNCRSFVTPASSTTAGGAIKALSGNCISYTPGVYPELTISNAANIPKHCRFDFDLTNSNVIVGQVYYK